MANKVLIIDSNEAERQEAVKAFAMYECAVVELDAPEKVVEVSKKEKPQLVLFDPRGSFAVLEKIKSDIALRVIPVVVHTAETARANVIKAAKLGARDYVLKPLAPDLLGERLEHIIELPRKKRNVNDAVRILILETKPLVVDQIKGICEGTPWEVIPVSRESEAFTFISTRLPDVILISLSHESIRVWQKWRVVLF